MKHLIITCKIIVFSLYIALGQDITIQINANEDHVPVSPYIYGRNNNFSDVFGTVTSAANIAIFKEAGLRFARENAGNNSTKYNWRLKLSSHPDWYNNVYSHDWDFASQTLLDNIPDLQAMWAFQLIGKVAANNKNNFNDWSYNGAKWWSGCAQNLAGGGVVNPEGDGNALVEGNPDLYLMDWPADSTVAILKHWFGNGGLGFPKENFMYWSMDNEAEIWNGTHDDVMPIQIRASEFMESYFEVAKKARALFPEIKLAGPVCANEWQWYKYADEALKINGKYYCWLEYFIKRIADEQKASGIRLLDVLDIHWYPSVSDNAQILQMHRIFYDEEYVYPGANGVKTLSGGWNNNQTKEFIFKRINGWLDTHLGEGHGVTLGLTESGINSDDPNINSVLYASMLGTFANNGVEVFSPWTWKTGMWETLHLFSRYAKNTSVKSESSTETIVSAYSTINSSSDSMTVILVNRDLKNARDVSINIDNFPIADGSYSTLELSALPSSETFKSHANNALKSSSVGVAQNSFTINLPPVSTTAVILKADRTGLTDLVEPNSDKQNLRLYPNPASGRVTLSIELDKPVVSTVYVLNQSGKVVDRFVWENSGVHSSIIDTEKYSKGLYFITVTNQWFTNTSKLIILK